MKRWFAKLVVFLLLGAIVNVAVAWGCAIGLEDLRNNWTMRGGAARLDNESMWGVMRFDRPGYFRIESFVGGPVEPWDDRWENPLALIEPWSRVASPKNLGERWHESASGWPFVSLWSRHAPADPLHDFVLAQDVRVLPRDRLDGAVLVDWSFLPKQLLLPARVIWLGFAINTVFYAVILWLLFAAPFALRRRIRIRRGLCPACAYPVGVGEVCTECGTPHSVKPKETPA